MFDWKLFLVLSIFALPGIGFSIGGFKRTYWPFIRMHLKNLGKFPAILVYTLGVLGISAASIAVGVALAPDVNSRFIFFQSLINEKNLGQAFQFEFLPGLAIGFLAALLFLFVYYYLFRKTPAPGLLELNEHDEKVIYSIEKYRNHLGLTVRIFFNAIVSEIIFRWGLQSVFIFILLSFLSNITTATILAIIISSALFGLAHLIPFIFVSGKKTGKLKMETIILYSALSLVYGTLFWKFGIFSAMAAHGLLHVVWYPLDVFYYRKDPDDE